MKKYLFSITILFISCQEEITLDLPNGEQKIVVQGTIENGLPPYVILTKNQGYFEEIGINTYSNLFIDDVDSIKVWYVENEIEVVKYLTKIPNELAEALTGEDIPLYTSTDLLNYIYFNGDEYLINEYSFSKAERTYFLELNWNGKIVTAQTTIPSPTPLDSLWVEKSENSEKDYKCDIRAVYSDPADIQNNILIKSKRKEHYERDKENSDTTLCEIINMMGPSFMRNICGDEIKHANYGAIGIKKNVMGTGNVPIDPTDYIDQLSLNSKTTPTGGIWISKNGLMEIISENGHPPKPDGLSWSQAAWNVVKSQKNLDL